MRIGGIVLGLSDAVLAAPAVPRRRVVRAQDLADLARFSLGSDWPFALDFIDEAHPGLARRVARLGYVVAIHEVLVASPRPAVSAPSVTILAGDPSELLSAHRLACLALGADPTSSPALASQLARRALRGSLTVAVCGPVEAPVATAAYRRVGPHAELVDVATTPERRRQGLASLVLAALESHAAQAGVHRLLAVAADRASAAWYARRGYRPLGTLVAVRARPTR